MSKEVENPQNGDPSADKDAPDMKQAMRRQVLAILPVYILQLCYGMSSAFPAIVIQQLSMQCAIFKITQDQESWIVSLDNIATPVVCILSGFLQFKFGPKRILMLTCFPYALSWVGVVLAAYIKNVYLLYASSLLVGVGHGFIATTVYTAEVSSREFRAPFSIFETVAKSIGLIIVYASGAFMEWNVIAFWAPIFPVIAFFVLLNSPESPTYLVAQGYFETAEKSLKKLKYDNYDIKGEIRIISQAVKVEEAQNQVKKVDYIKKINKHPELYKPFLIVLMLSIVQKFSGQDIIRVYVVKIFANVFKSSHHEVDDDDDVFTCEHGESINHVPYYSAIIVGLVRLFASLSLTKLLVNCKRKTLYVISSVGTILSLALFATILLCMDHLEDFGLDDFKDIIHWVSVVFACMAVFCINWGIEQMPLLMASELYPSELRAFCKGISRSITCILIVVALKLFPLMENSVNLYGTFYIYSGIVLFFFPCLMCILPETKGLSLSQINEVFMKNVHTVCVKPVED